MSKALISKIMSGSKKPHDTREIIKNENPIGEFTEENRNNLWEKVLKEKDTFSKSYYPDEDYIHMMYALIYVYNSYVESENEIKTPVLNFAYHYDRANKQYVVNMSNPEGKGVELRDRITYLTGKYTRTDYVNLKQIFNPSSFTERHKDYFFKAIQKADTSLQRLEGEPEGEPDEEEKREEPSTPKKIPGEDLDKKELSTNSSIELNQLYKIHQAIKNIATTIKQGKSNEGVIKNNIMSVKKEIYHNVLQLDVNITHEKAITPFSNKYDILYTLIDNIEEFYNKTPKEKFTPEIIKGLKSQKFRKSSVFSEIKGVELFPEEKEKVEEVKSKVNKIPDNVMRVIISDYLYIDIKLR